VIRQETALGFLQGISGEKLSWKLSKTGLKSRETGPKVLGACWIFWEGSFGRRAVV
jgi:hypothetical protein